MSHLLSATITNYYYQLRKILTAKIYNCELSTTHLQIQITGYALSELPNLRLVQRAFAIIRRAIAFTS